MTPSSDRIAPHQPAVSVVLPVYNRCDLLQRAMRSVAAQTFRDFELIVVDDGSTDGLPDIFGVDGFPSLNLIRHNENRGAAAARNTGIRAANGEWIAFLDSDDSWDSDKLAAQMAYVRERNSDVSVNCTGFRLHRRGQVTQTCFDMRPGEFASQILWGCGISPGSTLLVRRGVFDEIGMFDDSLRRLEDWDWLLRLSRQYDVTFLPRPLVDVFVENNISAGKGAEADPVLEAIGRIRDRHLPAVQKAGWVVAAKFRSTLHVERAARLHLTNRPLEAAVQVIAAMLSYPGRNLAFYRSLWRAVWWRLR